MANRSNRVDLVEYLVKHVAVDVMEDGMDSLNTIVRVVPANVERMRMMHASMMRSVHRLGLLLTWIDEMSVATAHDVRICNLDNEGGRARRVDGDDTVSLRDREEGS
jgi:hypothetical protein